MEKELFDWTDWDQLDTASFSFHQCVLRKDIGGLRSGMAVDCISVDYERGKMDFYSYERDDPFATFKLGLVVLPE